MLHHIIQLQKLSSRDLSKFSFLFIVYELPTETQADEHLSHSMEKNSILLQFKITASLPIKITDRVKREQCVAQVQTVFQHRL